ncbi:MAG TPA: ATP-binding protein [Mariniphaga anaerophila]|uniref:ATP-binding protein n=1 Tax=Mariniphaga anaerophila TaxID=1484053 RepID=A0A831LS99_9BACT|nr:ATP-binding protein [Mariniphaga anaerophila]
MNTNWITIRNPGGNAMGDSLRSLLEALEQWSRLSPGDMIIVDMSRVSFINPFLILPLCALISAESAKGIGIEIKMPDKIASYLGTVYFPHGFSIAETHCWRDRLSAYNRKTYLPASSFPVTLQTTAIREQFLTTFEQILMRQLNLKGQIITVIKYLISEAIDNITDHSGALYGWIMVQNYPQKGYLDVCIADTGKGISGSYKESGKSNVKSDALALEYAVNGKSTKNITETRGYGIDTSRRMLVNGLKGKYFLFSGQAFYIYTHELEQITPLPKYGWHGTVVALQIPAKAPEGFNYTTFLE